MSAEPTYTASTCRVAYQLNWSLSVFWRQRAVPSEHWLEGLREQTEKDGVRILEHSFAAENVSQFLLSTTPSISPASAVRSIKGRLQHLVRTQTPLALRRNYSIHSTGSANVETIERYVASQIERHPMADPRTQEILSRFQLHAESVDLSAERESAHGQYIYNLHVVLVYDGRGAEVREEWLQLTIDTLRRIAHKKGHLLGRASPVADHVHVLLGCDVSEAPEDVVLSYMNNLAHVHGGRRIFTNGYYAGTVGRYDLNATRR